MAVALGIDLVACDGWRRRLERTPRLAVLAFTPGERELAGGDALALAELWAVKEAVAKALGTGFDGIGWHGIEVREHAAARGTTRVRVRSDHAAHADFPTELALGLQRLRGHVLAVVVDPAALSAHAVRTAAVAPAGRPARRRCRSAAARRAAERAAGDVLGGGGDDGGAAALRWARTARGAACLAAGVDVSLSHTPDRAAAVVARARTAPRRPAHPRTFDLALARVATTVNP